MYPWDNRSGYFTSSSSALRHLVFFYSSSTTDLPVRNRPFNSLDPSVHLEPCPSFQHTIAFPTTGPPAYPEEEQASTLTYKPGSLCTQPNSTSFASLKAVSLHTSPCWWHWVVVVQLSLSFLVLTTQETSISVTSHHNLTWRHHWALFAGPKQNIILLQCSKTSCINIYCTKVQWMFSQEHNAT